MDKEKYTLENCISESEILTKYIKKARVLWEELDIRKISCHDLSVLAEIHLIESIAALDLAINDDENLVDIVKKLAEDHAKDYVKNKKEANNQVGDEKKEG